MKAFTEPSAKHEGTTMEDPAISLVAKHIQDKSVRCRFLRNALIAMGGRQ
jgi:hypothetical protein